MRGRRSRATFCSSFRDVRRLGCDVRCEGGGREHCCSWKDEKRVSGIYVGEGAAAGHDGSQERTESEGRESRQHGGSSINGARGAGLTRSQGAVERALVQWRETHATGGSAKTQELPCSRDPGNAVVAELAMSGLRDNYDNRRPPCGCAAAGFWPERANLTNEGMRARQEAAAMVGPCRTYRGATVLEEGGASSCAGLLRKREKGCARSAGAGTVLADPRHMHKVGPPCVAPE